MVKDKDMAKCRLAERGHYGFASVEHRTQGPPRRELHTLHHDIGEGFKFGQFGDVHRRYLPHDVRPLTCATAALNSAG